MVWKRGGSARACVSETERVCPTCPLIGHLWQADDGVSTSPLVGSACLLLGVLRARFVDINRRLLRSRGRRRVKLTLCTGHVDARTCSLLRATSTAGSRQGSSAVSQDGGRPRLGRDAVRQRAFQPSKATVLRVRPHQEKPGAGVPYSRIVPRESERSATKAREQQQAPQSVKIPLASLALHLWIAWAWGI